MKRQTKTHINLNENNWIMTKSATFFLSFSLLRLNFDVFGNFSPLEANVNLYNGNNDTESQITVTWLRKGVRTRERISMRASKRKRGKEIKANKSILNVNLIRVLLFLEHCFVLFVLNSKIHSFCYFFSKKNRTQLRWFLRDKIRIMMFKFYFGCIVCLLCKLTSSASCDWHCCGWWRHFDHFFSTLYTKTC